MKFKSKHHINQKEMEEEFRIIEMAKQDIDAFKPLYNKYYNEIKKSVENTLYVQYAIKNEDLTKDITASVFARALTNLHQYKTINGTPFKSWLYRIMQNEIIGYIRKTIREEKYEKEIGQQISQYEGEMPFFNVNYNSSHDIKLSYLKKYIPRLAVQEQMLIQYRFFNEYSYKQIAQIMGLSENSLRTRMTRLLKKIQTYIENKSA